MYVELDFVLMSIGAYRGKKKKEKASVPQEVELQEVVSYPLYTDARNLTPILCKSCRYS